MRLFARFAAAFTWAIVVVGLGAWVISLINPDRPAASSGEFAAAVGVLAASGVLAVAGFFAV